MANSFYDAARKNFMDGNFNLVSNTIKAFLIDAGAYTVAVTTHDFLDDVASGARIAGPVTLASKATTAGAFDADDITFSSVTGVSIEAILLYKFVTADADSPLICYIDTATGLPITPNGGDIIVTWDNGTNKIFRV
jgi:hypothetical protein